MEYIYRPKTNELGPPPTEDSTSALPAGYVLEVDMNNKEKYEILDWFAGRCGDVIKNADYQQLFPELARILGAGQECKTTIDVYVFMKGLKT